MGRHVAFPGLGRDLGLGLRGSGSLPALGLQRRRLRGGDRGRRRRRLGHLALLHLDLRERVAQPPAHDRGLDGEVDAGDGEPVLAAPRDRRVDADHVAVSVEQRPARVAAVDAGLHLVDVLAGHALEVGPLAADPAGGQRPLRAVLGMADGRGGLADADVALGEQHRGQARGGAVDVQDRQILGRIPGEQLRVEPALQVGLVGAGHLLGLQENEELAERLLCRVIQDHVRVGHHQARLVDDRAGAHRAYVAFLAVDQDDRRRDARVESFVVDLLRMRCSRAEDPQGDDSSHGTHLPMTSPISARL